MLLSVGPILVPSLPGLRAVQGASSRALAIGSAGILLALGLLFFVRISGGFMGRISRRADPARLDPDFAGASAHDHAPAIRGTSSPALVLLVGVPTTAIDTWNAQDIGNRREGPGFRWTLWTTRDQQQAFAWLRAQTPESAIVQMEPMVRGREHWTLIPSFAGRRMAAGLPISLLPQPEYTRGFGARQDAVLNHPAPMRRLALARRLRIDYLYVDDADARAYPDGVRKFDESPALFARVFTSGAGKDFPRKLTRMHESHYGHCCPAEENRSIL